MKWVTREHVKVDRVACPWLIRKFVDPQAQFLFVPPEQVLEVARREGAIPYDVTGAELGHHQGKCSFEAIVTKYKIDDPAVRLLAQIVHGAAGGPDGGAGRPTCPSGGARRARTMARRAKATGPANCSTHESGRERTTGATVRNVRTAPRSPSREPG